MKKANPTLIGAFVLGALLLLALAIAVLGGSALFSTRQNAVIYFDGAVTGLNVGAPVTFRGVHVGEVRSILLQLDTNTFAARIPVYIVLEPTAIQVLGDKSSLRDIPFTTFVEKGLRTKLVNQSFLTGQLAIELDFLPDRPAVLVAGGGSARVPEIPAVKSDFDVIRDQLASVNWGQMANDLRDTLSQVRGLAQTANSTLQSISGDIKSTAAATSDTASTLSVAVKQLSADTHQSLLAVQTLTRHLDREVTTMSPQLRATLAHAQSALDHADATLAHTSELTAPGTAARADLESALRNLAIAAQALRDFSETVERNPQALIRGAPQK